MRAKSFLQYIVFALLTWTVVGFATLWPTRQCCFKRRVSSFVNPNDLLEGGSELIRPGAEILLQFLPAADPRWACIGPVGIESFVLSREGGPIQAELTNENILKIVTIECSDLEVNTIVWKCLGYRFNSMTKEWSATECFPKWRDKYPIPPDLIGMQRMYVNH